VRSLSTKKEQVIFDQGYLLFVLLKRGKTERWDVRSVKHGNRLGIIKWHGAWFRYAFFPESDTLFDAECLKILRAFIAIRDEVRRGNPDVH